MLLRVLERVAPALVVGAMLFVAVTGMVPSTVVSREADPSRFSAERALTHIEAIAVAPRPMGSPANAAAREYVARELEALDLDVSTSELVVPSQFSDEMVPVVNTWAVIPGTDPTGGIVLMGHIDTFPETPGANDDAAAVAVVLESARAILVGPRLRNDVVLLVTDGEEPSPRWGSTAFATNAPGVGFVINFEAIGGSGASLVTDVVGDEMAIVGAYAEAALRPVATSVLDDLAELLGGSNTDLAPFRHLGVPGIEFAYFQGSPIYHTAADDVASVHLGSVQHHGDHGLALARAVGAMDLADLDGTDQAVFFSIAGSTVVVYPAVFGLVAAVSLSLVVLLALGREVRTRRVAWPDLVRAACWHAVVALSVGTGLAAAWWVLFAVLWSDSGPVGFMAFVWWAVAASAVIAAVVLWRRRLLRKCAAGAFEWGGLLLWSTLGLVLAYLIPGAGYLFVWTGLAALVFTVRRSGARWSRLGALAAVALPAVVLTVPVLDLFFQFSSPRPGNTDSQIPEIMLLFGFVLTLGTLLLAPHWERARPDQARLGGPRVGGSLPGASRAA